MLKISYESLIKFPNELTMSSMLTFVEMKEKNVNTSKIITEETWLV